VYGHLKETEIGKASRGVQARSTAGRVGGVLPYLPSSPGCYSLEQTRVIMDKAFVLISDYEEVESS
jgi:hypothetical protein